MSCPKCEGGTYHVIGVSFDTNDTFLYTEGVGGTNKTKGKHEYIKWESIGRASGSGWQSRLFFGRHRVVDGLPHNLATRLPAMQLQLNHDEWAWLRAVEITGGKPPLKKGLNENISLQHSNRCRGSMDRIAVSWPLPNLVKQRKVKIGISNNINNSDLVWVTNWRGGHVPPSPFTCPRWRPPPLFGKTALGCFFQTAGGDQFISLQNLAK